MNSNCVNHLVNFCVMFVISNITNSCAVGQLLLLYWNIVCGRRDLFCCKPVAVFPLAVFCRSLGYFYFIVFMMELEEIFQSTTAKSLSYFSGRGLFFGTSAEGLLPSNWVACCQLWKETQENPSFTFRSGYGWPWENFILSALLMSWGDSAWRWGSSLPQMSL